jgi:hypothetical protein
MKALRSWLVASISTMSASWLLMCSAMSQKGRGGPHEGGGGSEVVEWVVAGLMVAVIAAIAIGGFMRSVDQAQGGNGKTLFAYIFWIMGIPLSLVASSKYGADFWLAVLLGFGMSFAVGLMACVVVERLHASRRG